MWNVALAGTACGNLLTLTENAYGYPESKQSIKRGQYLETVECEFAENEPDAELAKGLTSKEAATAEAESQPPPAKQRKRLPQGPDKCKLQATTAVIPSTTICIKPVYPKSAFQRGLVQKVSQSISVCIPAAPTQQHNLPNAVLIFAGSTWVCVSNVSCVITTVSDLWTFKNT